MQYMDQGRRRKIILIWLVAICLVVISGLGGIGWYFSHNFRSNAQQQATAFNGNEPVVVMFYSSTCQHCHQAAPKVHVAKLISEVEAELDNRPDDQKPRYLFLDYQNAADRKYFAKYGIGRTPTFMVLDHGAPRNISSQPNQPQFAYTGTDGKNIRQLYVQLQLREGQ